MMFALQINQDSSYYIADALFIYLYFRKNCNFTVKSFIVKLLFAGKVTH